MQPSEVLVYSNYTILRQAMLDYLRIIRDPYMHFAEKLTKPLNDAYSSKIINSTQRIGNRFRDYAVNVYDATFNRVLNSAPKERVAELIQQLSESELGATAYVVEASRRLRRISQSSPSQSLDATGRAPDPAELRIKLSVDRYAWEVKKVGVAYRAGRWTADMVVDDFLTCINMKFNADLILMGCEIIVGTYAFPAAKLNTVFQALRDKHPDKESIIPSPQELSGPSPASPTEPSEPSPPPGRRRRPNRRKPGRAKLQTTSTGYHVTTPTPTPKALRRWYMST